MRRSAAAGQSRGRHERNPVYQQIQAAAEPGQRRDHGLRSELAVHQQNVAELRGMIDTAPEVEAEYSRLTRDYDVVKAQYNELVSRLDRARISEQAEQTGVVRFEVIDPPSVSIEPVAPNRPRLICHGAGRRPCGRRRLAFVLNQLRPVFDNVAVADRYHRRCPCSAPSAGPGVERHRAERRQRAGTGARSLHGALVARVRGRAAAAGTARPRPSIT